jgi:lactate dehydrogenase-like 2-hydroxyacid dehydrogenase
MSFNVYVTRELPAKSLEMLRAACDRVDVNPDDRVLTRDELLESVAGRDGVLCLLTDSIDDEVFAAAGPQCRMFANYAVGFNNVDVDAATRRKILISNTPGVLTETTADLAWALMLAVSRRIVESDNYFRTGRWTGWGPMQFLGHDIHGATLGIVGAGRIGTATGLRAAGFNMNILYTSNKENDALNAIGGRRVHLDALLAESDFVSIHVALNDQTRHYISDRQLKRMKPSAYLINTTRGPVIDEKALVRALQKKVIAGAALDVYENEPAPAPGLVDLDNVVCIPHLGSATEATREKMAVMAAANLLAGLRGQRPPNLVNPDAL